MDLQSIFRIWKHLRVSDARIQEIQTALTLIQDDFNQIIQCPITEEIGEELPSLLINKTDSLKFTRGGYTNLASEFK
ncbi:hypothetical protein [Candidatus Coxiella mudrowiae]|uniref:hypothetical protein n=1 Tax=Candidatus Coxiella mudrowiae TaxID=2054173 RepID=UPI001561D67C|nr:hypothetical protein [Candidatus Coxiella mudrowiae]